MNLQEKEKAVEELKEKLSRAQSLILTDYRGLSVDEITTLRNQLRELEVEFHVVKNTLTSRAVEGLPMEPLKEHLVGPTAIAFSFGEPTGAAKVISKYCHDNPKLEFKVGALSDSLFDKDGLKKLAELPSRENLLSMVLQGLAGVPRGFLTVLTGVHRQFVQVLVAIQDKKEKEA